MSLFNILADLPHERLRSLANEFGISSASPSKRTILNDLAAQYRSEDFISQIVHDLPPTTQGLLRGLVYYTPKKETITIPPALRLAWCDLMSLEEQILPLLDMGLLFPNPAGESGSVIFPEEIRSTLEALFSSPFRRLQPQGEYELESMAVRCPALEAIFHLLCVLLRHPAVQTQRGTIHRKTIERWAARLGDAGTRESFFPFVFSFCDRRDFFIVQKKHFRSSPLAAQWFLNNEKVLRNEIWSHYLQTRILPNRHKQNFLPIFEAIHSPIRSDSMTPVFTLSDMYSLVEEDMDNEQFVEEMRWLAFLGLLRFNDWQMPTSFHLTRDGIEILCHCDVPKCEPMPSDFCVLQPNFDLLVPPAVGYSMLWKLEQLAEFKRRDVFTEYHLSKDSILFGMRRGWMREEVLSFFSELTGGKLSENVKYCLEEWCRKYGQITLRRIVLVECATPDLAEEITHVPELRGMLEQRLSEHCYAVSETNARAVLRILRERGYEPSAAKRLTDEE